MSQGPFVCPQLNGSKYGYLILIIKLNSNHLFACS